MLFFVFWMSTFSFPSHVYLFLLNEKYMFISLLHFIHYLLTKRYKCVLLFYVLLPPIYYNHKESSVFYSDLMILKIITLEHGINLYLFKFKT